MSANFLHLFFHVFILLQECPVLQILLHVYKYNVHDIVIQLNNIHCTQVCINVGNTSCSDVIWKPQQLT